MRTNISALIVYDTPNSITKDIHFTNGIEGEAYDIELKHIRNTDNILRDLYNFRGVDCIITIGDVNTLPLTELSFEIRKKWVHFEEYNAELINNSIILTFVNNINRDRGDDKLFSIFTCAYKTPKEKVLRLYNSLCRQTYKNWNWWVLDDTPYGITSYYEKIMDPRINIIRNVTSHGNIGFNKHLIAMACDGDYLAEVDHDDELTDNCLERLREAFVTYPDISFAYSHAMEEIDGEPIKYSENFALGLGTYRNFDINGKIYNCATTPNVNSLSLRHIVGLPNHIRCWEKNFYHKIGGHNPELSILDDMDLLIRTLLNCKSCKIESVLYIQHEGSSADANGRGSTTQGKRFGEILRTGVFLKNKYDKEIHDYFISNGMEDPYWTIDNNGNEYANIWDGPKPMTDINYVLV